MTKHIPQQMLRCSVTLTPKQALALRDLGVDLEYHCPNPDCSQPVIVISKGKDKDGVKYRAHFEHKARNPTCHFGIGIKTAAAGVSERERHLREDGIVGMEPILAGTAYWGRAEAEFADAIENEDDPKRKKAMAKRLDDLAVQVKDRSIEERVGKLLKEIDNWKK